MSGRVAAILALGLFAVAIACLALLWMILTLPHDQPLAIERSGSSPLFLVVLLSFSLVGGLIVSHQPRHPVGWIFCLTSPLTAFSGFATGYADYARVVPGSLPAGEFVGVLSGISYFVGFTMPVTLGLLLFPDGRLPARSWLPVALLMPLGVILMTIAAALTKQFGPPVPLVGVFGGLTLLAGILCSVASLIYRWRRAAGSERQQLKWVAAAAAVIALALISLLAVSWLGIRVPSEFPFAVMTGGLSLFPVSVGIAIMRYGLYDIDVLINRTLVYGATTATLIAAYAVTALVAQTLLRPFTQGSEFAVAASTLVVAALIQPVRRRIQSAVDRRFYRSRYDAARTVDTFALRLRDEVDLDALRAQLLVVARDTMQPAHASVWLRERP